MRLTGQHHALQMRDFAASRFRDLIGPADIAAAVGLNPAYASALFRRHGGETLTAHLTRLRIAHAQELLSRPDQTRRSIADIAVASGFCSLSRFYEAFKSITGRRPSDFRGPINLAAQPEPVHTPVVHALWVDDQPVNNVRERRVLASLGIYADTARTNDEAAAALRQAPYTLVISDVSRPGQRECGWDFARHVRRHHPATPFLFYCGFVDIQRRGIARRAGAAAICNQPAQLIGAATLSIGR